MLSALSSRLQPWLLCPLLLLCLLFGCSGKSVNTGSLLDGHEPISTRGLIRSAQLNDGQVPGVGSFWNSSATTIFTTLSSEVIYDLGAIHSVGSIALLGDNNDVYEIATSLDGELFETIWRAEPKSLSGLQWRSTDGLAAQGRFIRLRPLRGDSALSVAELVVYEQAQGPLPPVLQQVRARDTGLYYRSMLLNLTGIILLSILFLSPRAPRAMRFFLLLFCGYGAFYAASAFVKGYPFEPLAVSLTRGLVATMALGVVLREGWLSGKSWPIFKQLHVGLLLLLSVLSVGAFYNLGKAQFFDHQLKSSSLVHHYDMRVYFPAAKYFEELKYDGVYLGSVASYAEEHSGLESKELRRTSLRDLRDHKLVMVPQLRQELEAINERFTPERWQEFKLDMAYFWQAMGSKGYLGSLRDHGGNATPLWLALVHLMFQGAEAGDTVLLLGALLDPLLLFAFFVCVWRTFGVTTACISLIIFGSNEFYMFGSNWAGATLRNDWMVYLGFGVCAMAKKRYYLGGALLALSALIRAFPVFSLLALGMPIALWAVQTRRSAGCWPGLKKLKKEQAWFLQTVCGAAVSVVVLCVASSLVLGWDAWPLWLQKISSFSASPHVNHLSLLSVVAGSQSNQAVVLGQRMPFYLIGQFLFVVLALWASRDLKPHQVALLGLILMPVFLYPANYYLHSIFLLPLLVAEPMLQKSVVSRIKSARVWCILLLLCMAQYLTVREENLDVHFYNASLILCAALLSILYVLLPRDAEGRVELPFR